VPIEHEWKFLVSKNDLETLRTLLKLKWKSKDLVNVYFDTKKSDLKKQESTLRLRFFLPSKAEITFKQKSTFKDISDSHFKSYLEINQEIKIAQAKRWLKQKRILRKDCPKTIQKYLKLSTFEYLGELRTQRASGWLNKNTRIDLDACEMIAGRKAKRFCEVEVECLKPSKKDLQRILKLAKKNKIQLKPIRRTKLQALTSFLSRSAN